MVYISHFYSSIFISSMFIVVMKLQLHYGAKLLIDLMALQYSLWDKKRQLSLFLLE
jgi:hypothetical protein